METNTDTLIEGRLAPIAPLEGGPTNGRPAEPADDDGKNGLKGTVGRWLSVAGRKGAAPDLEVETVTAEAFEAETRVLRLTAGPDTEHFLKLLKEARDALDRTEPRVLFAKRLVGIVNDNIGFRFTLLPHFGALLILLAYFGGLAALIPRIFFAEAFGTAVWNVYLSLATGTAGGAVSLALDFPKLFRRGEPAFIAVIKVALRPLLGGILAAFFVSLILGGYLRPLVPPLLQIGLTDLPASQVFYSIVAMGFLFGFAERVPTMLIERATQQSLGEMAPARAPGTPS